MENSDALLNKIKSYQKNPDINLIKKAYALADAAHLGEKRISGEPHIKHCLGTALLLVDLKVDTASIAAALLHDTIEHTDITKKDLEKEFGETVANLVDGVTVIKSVKTKTGEGQQVENLRKLLLATAKDVRVVLIRLAEKLHNLQTIDALSSEKRKIVISKVFDIYAPLAERLGVYHFKWQLEDYAFKFQNHAEHSRIQEHLAETREAREDYIEKVKEILSKELKKADISAEVEGRPKHIYSIYKKMQIYKKPGELEEKVLRRIYDKHAIRIFVKNDSDCYLALSIVHSLWKPVPGRFDDYITNPKPNGYRSLHTDVFGPEGKSIEFQIKTYEMHEFNEFGPASHLFYKELGREKGGKVPTPVDRLSWLKDLVEWQEEIAKEKDFEDALKIDVFGDRVFVFTPKGDIKDLPVGSTPIDFAYMVHTNLGHNCISAKVNGKLVSLTYQLQNSDVCEILVSKKPKGPSRDWLKFVKTRMAQHRIKKWFREEINV